MTKPCDPKQDRQPSPRRSMGLSPCWVAHGDGFATATDRAYVTEAAARVQTVFALALLERLPDDFERQREGLGPCTDWLAGNGTPDSGCDLAWTAFLLDPSPEWTRTRPLTEPGDVGSWAATIIGSTWTALASLSARNIRCCANAGSPVAQPNLLPPGIFDGAFASDEAAGGSVQPAENIGYWLVRPLLVAWPAAQSDVTTLAGGDEFHRGWQAQIAVNAAFGAANLFHSDASTSVWAGVGGGVGYATVGIFPGRANRTLFETNAGVAQGYYLAGSNVSFRSLSVLEIRAPITSFALYGAAALFHSRLPLALLGDKMSWGLLGGRIYATPGTNKLLLSGWDAEIANLYLGTPGSSNAALSGITASELRIRLGWRSTNFERIHSMFDGAPFVALELSSGFYTTLL